MLTLVLAGVVGMGIYAYKNYFKKQTQFERKITEEFKKIGKVKEILVYPLDGGPGHNVDSALCTKTGVVAGHHQDRCHIAYAPLNKVAFLNVRNPELATLNLSKLWSDLEKFPFPTKREVKINYLGRTIKVQDYCNKIANSAVDVLGNVLIDPMGVRIGFCSPENRKHFNENKVKHLDENTTEEVDDFSPYFAPYTLINSESVKYLEQKTKAQIRPSNFRANVVIEGLDAFCEDEIFRLKIGNIFFNNVKPCTHVPSAFIDQSNIKNPEKLQPYKFLRKCFPNDVRPPLDGLKFPIFGITMELDKLDPINPYYDPEIKVGDVVVAQLYYKEVITKKNED